MFSTFIIFLKQENDAFGVYVVINNFFYLIANAKQKFKQIKGYITVEKNCYRRSCITIHLRPTHIL